MSLFDRTSGWVFALLCVIVVTLSGVGLSLVVDRKSAVAKKKKRLVVETRELILETERWEMRRNEREKYFDDRRKTADSQRKILQNISLSYEEGLSKRETLRLRVETLGKEVIREEEEKPAVLAGIMREARGRAVGEHLGELPMPDGRVLRGVVIRRVTASGVEVKHDHGFATLSPEELPERLRGRFEWEKNADGKALPTTRKPETAPKPRQPAENKGKNEEISRRRKEYADARNRYLAVDAEYRSAASGAASGNSRSAPGSLETWEARKARLGTLRDKLRIRRDVAWELLRQVDPGTVPPTDSFNHFR